MHRQKSRSFPGVDLNIEARIWHPSGTNSGRVRDASREAGLLDEIRRVMRRDGQVMIFEHNPLNPLTVHAVNTCPFDENAVLIRARSLKHRLERAGFRNAEVKYRIFFPRALRWLRPLENLLGWLPLGAQYYALARK